MPSNARERWLDSLPAMHAVHRQQLRDLLHHHASAETRDFLNTLPRISESTGAKAPATPARLPPGTAIGPYVIEEEIGRGGMGSVWRARRGDGVLKRMVALKLPHVGSHGDELMERFARERDILAELSHPNIARLYDAGFSETGQ
ncbi:MAG TPA: protein kinase, partial [Steroidobacteraceae bacterium]|nr:protein kinase [Steroidobacteraceae bacterium]